MERPTFLDRQPLGIPNYLAIALVAVLFVAVIPRGARKALETNTNNVEDWLPASYTESLDLVWFRQQFGNEAFMVLSWDGCTLGNTEKLNQLAQRLANEPLTPEMAEEAGVAPHADRRIFARVMTGPDMIDKLANPPASLDRDQAIERLTGAFLGPPTVEGDDSTRTTCLMAYLSRQATSNNRTMRMGIERVIEIATQDYGIKAEELHMGGPPVDNVSIDIEGERTLSKLAGLSGLVGIVLAYACFRSLRLTGMVLFVAVVSAGASLATVYYFGAVEVLAMGADSARLGKLDAILMSMPAVVYVLGLSGAIHLVNYYRDAVDAGGRRGAVERAVRMALMPCGVAAFTTAIGLASLASSDILPIEKFGVFSAIGVLLALGLLFSILPVALHRYAPPNLAPGGGESGSSLPGWARRAVEGICHHHGWVAVGSTLLMVLFAFGLPRITSSVKLIKLLDPQSDLVQDYAWLEQHLGNLVPMEVVIAVPEAMRRGVNDHPEADGEHYAMATVERLRLIRRIGQHIEALPAVSRTLNASTFSPGEMETRSPSNRRTHDYVVSEAIDENRETLHEFLTWEKDPDSPTDDGTHRELWRASARVAALSDIDYGEFVRELRDTVEPVLDAYRARSHLVEQLNQQDKQLVGARILLVVPEDFSAEDVLFAELLREAGVETVANGRRGKLHEVAAESLNDMSDKAREQITQLDAIVTRDPAIAKKLADLQLPAINVSTDNIEGEDGLVAIYTGVMPLVYKTQRQLLVSLQESLVMATLLIAVVLMVLLRSIGGGLAAMIPNLFPLVVVFGGLGWLSIPVDIGIMMTASVALGVAVDDTIHFVSWFRRGLSVGMSRYDAAIEAYERCAKAMVQTTLVAGLGLAVFSVSTFTPTKQFGYLMVTILAAALVGDLILLPALLVGPIGALFRATRRASDDLSELMTNVDTPADQAEHATSQAAATTSTPPATTTATNPVAAAPPEPPPAEQPVEQQETAQATTPTVEAGPSESIKPNAPPTPANVAPHPTNSPAQNGASHHNGAPKQQAAEDSTDAQQPLSPRQHSGEPIGQPHSDLSPANAELHERLRRFRRDQSPR